MTRQLSARAAEANSQQEDARASRRPEVGAELESGVSGRNTKGARTI